MTGRGTPNQYRIEGEITLIDMFTKDGVYRMSAKIDTGDIELVRPYTWRPVKTHPKSNTYYVQAHVWKEGKDGSIYLHSLIQNLPPRSILEVDHRNGEGLDNTRKNLISITHAQNHQNRQGLQTNNTSGSAGVSWRKDRNCWAARIKVQGRVHHLGHFLNKIQAEEAVNSARKELMPYAR